MARNIERVDEDDPNRCQAQMNAGNQCRNKSLEGQQYCTAHSAHIAGHGDRKKQKRNYFKTRWKATIEQYADSPNIKSLRDEIGILRMMLDEKLERCNDAQNLAFEAQVISDLVEKINKTVTACHRLESSMGELLDRAALMQFAQEVVNIISSNVNDENTVNEISNQILKSAATISKEQAKDNFKSE